MIPILDLGREDKLMDLTYSPQSAVAYSRDTVENPVIDNQSKMKPDIFTTSDSTSELCVPLPPSVSTGLSAFDLLSRVPSDAETASCQIYSAST